MAPRGQFSMARDSTAGDCTTARSRIGPVPQEGSENLVAYVRAMELQRGDVQRLTITDPQGKPFAS